MCAYTQINLTAHTFKLRHFRDKTKAPKVDVVFPKGQLYVTAMNKTFSIFFKNSKWKVPSKMAKKKKKKHPYKRIENPTWYRHSLQ